MTAATRWRRSPSTLAHQLICWVLSLLLVVASSATLAIDEAAAPAATATTMASSRSSLFPSNITLRAAVLTHAEPFAMLDPTTGQYSGLQIDLLHALVEFAAADNVTLTFALEEAPINGYVLMFDRLSDNCNTTDNPQPQEECGTFDLLIGDYYTNPDRSMRVDFTPPWLRTAVSAMKYNRPRNATTSTATTTSDNGNQPYHDVTTLAEAVQANACICVVYDSYMDGVVMEKFPTGNYYKCEAQDDCVEHLKAGQCALFVDDELQLRYRAVQDATLHVTMEQFNTQFIVWPMRSNLPATTQKLLKRWFYAAQSNSTLDALYDQYFSVNLCPLGKAGKDCDKPCHASHGRSDRLGICVCDSTLWTGSDCSVEVMEDTNGIPATLILIGYIMFGINVTAVTICGVWLWFFRHSPQVQVAQPFFLFFVLLGCLISTSTILPMAQENLDSSNIDDNDSIHTACMAIPWLYSVGFSITFGSLFAKIRRIYVLFRAAVDMRRIRISIPETVGMIGGVLLLDVTVLTVWTLVDPLQWQRNILTTDKYQNPLTSEGYCTSHHWMIFAGIIASLHLSLLGFASWLCYKARDIPSKFNEGKMVAIAMFSNLQIFIIGLPVLIILGSDPKSSFFVRSIIIW